MRRITLEDDLTVSNRNDEDVLAIEDALTKLAEFDSRQAQIVELRFFGGLTVEEVAQVLDVSKRTVESGLDRRASLVAPRVVRRGRYVTPSEFAKVKEVFNDAIRVPERDRSDFIRKASDENETIIAEVVSLLSHHVDDTILESTSRTEPDILQEPLRKSGRQSPRSHPPSNCIPIW